VRHSSTALLVLQLVQGWISAEVLDAAWWTNVQPPELAAC
jgi:hypothetical protein